MQMFIDKTWLQNKIASDPDINTDAGLPLEHLENIDMFLSSDLIKREIDHILPLKHAFGMLTNQLRRKENMSIVELAENAHILVEELSSIETDPNFKPNPRTVYQLASFFNVSAKTLMKLSGATLTYNKEFEEKALRFAAKSSQASKLTEEEIQILNEYVKYLNEESNG